MRESSSNFHARILEIHVTKTLRICLHPWSTLQISHVQRVFDGEKCENTISKLNSRGQQFGVFKKFYKACTQNGANIIC